jgi:putative transposase
VGPAPERGKGTRWEEFLRAHWEILGAADFFPVELWSWGRLTRYHVFFVIRLATRSVHVAGIIQEPDGRWMRQVGRNLTDCQEGFVRECRFLIHDRATVFTKEFVSILGYAGVESIHLPGRSPNLNAFAERFVRSIKSECLDHLILVGERSLRRAVDDFCAHYHEERNHQGWTTS